MKLEKHDDYSKSDVTPATGCLLMMGLALVLALVIHLAYLALMLGVGAGEKLWLR